MDLEQERRRGEQAKQLLEDAIFQEAVSRLGQHLEAKVLGCDPDDAKKTQRVVLAKQILRGLVREIESIATYGDVARIKLDEIETKKVSLFRR